MHFNTGENPLYIITMHIYAQEYVTLFFYREIMIISTFEREEQYIYS